MMLNFFLHFSELAGDALAIGLTSRWLSSPLRFKHQPLSLPKVSMSNLFDGEFLSDLAEQTTHQFKAVGGNAMRGVERAGRFAAASSIPLTVGLQAGKWGWKSSDPYNTLLAKK
jgi:hypothetical protein